MPSNQFCDNHAAMFLRFFFFFFGWGGGGGGGGDSCKTVRNVTFRSVLHDVMPKAGFTHCYF